MTSSAAASIHEIAPDTYRINIPLPDALPGGFSFNQYLVLDEKPLLFHTGPKKLFPLIRAQIETVMPLAEASLRRVLALRGRRVRQPAGIPRGGARGTPLCSDIAALVSVSDFVDVPPIGMRDGEELEPRPPHRRLAIRAAPAARMGVRLPLRRDDAPAVLRRSLHAAGLGERPVVEDDILAPSEAFRAADGLLRACAGHRQAHRQARGPGTRVPRVHARQRVARQRWRAVAGPRARRWRRLGARPTPPRRVRRQRNRNIASCGGVSVAAMLCRCSRPPPRLRAALRHRRRHPDARDALSARPGVGPRPRVARERRQAPRAGDALAVRRRVRPRGPLRTRRCTSSRTMRC